MRRLLGVALVLCGVGAGALLLQQRAPPPALPSPRVPQLRALGPRVFSNQTSQPLTVVGEDLAPGDLLALGPPFSRTLPLTVLDARHAYARTPSELLLPADESEREVTVTLQGGLGSQAATVVNDSGFVELTALVAARSPGLLFAASATTDQVFAIQADEGKVASLAAGDGPAALALWTSPEGREWLLVAHAFEPSLWLLSVDGPFTERQRWPAPKGVAGLTVDASRQLVYLATQVDDAVVALDLRARGRERWRTRVGPNPRALTLTARGLAVGSLQSGDVSLLDPASGALLHTAAPGPGTPIVGGGTARFSSAVMGGKAVRGLAYSRRADALFLASVGPNVGPNPERMEVSANGGVSVLEGATAKTRWHLGFGAGVTEALALDDGRGLLYASDPALGVVRVLDAASLARSVKGSAAALLQTLELPPPEGWPLVRPAEELGRGGLAGPSIHSGPRALALSGDGQTLYVLNRSTATLAVVDAREARRGRARVVRQLKIAEALTQPQRRAGQVLYVADLGRTAMSCDACHLEGHTEGVLFEKTHPLRIYRSTTVRGARVSPPYFTPMSTRSLAETAEKVGGRNRFHRAELTAPEVTALAGYTAAITWLPNPFVGEDGAPVESLTLPDGRTGRPREGLRLFEGKAGCAGCHPPPHFTTDQDPSTRGRYLDVGTPRALPLRLALQDLSSPGFAPPSLLGSWDVFPMLGSGAAGFSVSDAGTLATMPAMPIRLAVFGYGGQHGKADALTEQERDDLVAYVLSL